MALLTGVGKGLRSRAKGVGKRYKDWQENKPAREQKRLDDLREKTRKAKVEAHLERERLEAKAEVVRAKTALKKAKTANKKAQGKSLLSSLFGKKKRAAPRKRRKPVTKAPRPKAPRPKPRARKRSRR